MFFPFLVAALVAIQSNVIAATYLVLILGSPRTCRLRLTVLQNPHTNIILVILASLVPVVVGFLFTHPSSELVLIGAGAILDSTHLGLHSFLKVCWQTWQNKIELVYERTRNVNNKREKSPTE